MWQMQIFLSVQSSRFGRQCQLAVKFNRTSCWTWCVTQNAVISHVMIRMITQHTVFCFAPLAFKDCLWAEMLLGSLSLDRGRGRLLRESCTCENSNSKRKTCWWEALSCSSLQMVSLGTRRLEGPFLLHRALMSLPLLLHQSEVAAQ